MKKIKVAIIGSGNIGTDILLKIQRSDYLECTLFIGRRENSAGIQIAKELGIETSIDSIHAIEKNPNICDIVFDATSASAHKYNYQILEKMNKFTLDLTPAHIGKFCIPVLNLNDVISTETNINLITCGGQSSVPIVKAITDVCDNIKYVELVATISSKSAGIGTRNNIDEYTQTTKNALIEFTGIKNAKAIIVLNPAEPPITMRNTIYLVVDNPNIELINKKVKEMEKNIQKYVPGYKIVLGPIYENGKITLTIEVEGMGDYLPKYSGNLDIITQAAVNIAEEYAKKRMGENIHETIKDF